MKNGEELITPDRNTMAKDMELGNRAHWSDSEMIILECGELGSKWRDIVSVRDRKKKGSPNCE